MITVAGGVAEAKLKGIAFDTVWNSDSCSLDLRDVKRLRKYPEVSVELAVETVTGWFDDPAVWAALCGLAERLEAGKPLDGPRAWDIYSTALAAQQDTDDAEPDVPFVPSAAVEQAPATLQ